MIGGLSPSAIMALRDRQQAQQPMPIQSAMPAPAQAGGANPMQGTGGVPALILAKLLQQKQAQAQAQQAQAPATPQNWRDQPMYLGHGTAGQTYNSMGGDWRSQPAYLPVDTPNPGGKFTLADPFGSLLHLAGIHGIGPAESNNRGLFGLGLGKR